MNVTKQKLITPFLLLSYLIISSCGFQLRGNVSLPEIYQIIYIDNKSNSNIATRLKEVLVENNIKLVNNEEDASSIIRIFSHHIERRAIAVRGKEIKEYEVQLSISFSLHDNEGKQRGEQQTITNSRRYSFNNEQVLGSTNEELILLNEMKFDIVNKILRRISKIK